MKKKKLPEIHHKSYERIWTADPDSYMKFGFVENGKPPHDVIYYEWNFKKEAKSPDDSIYQQTLIQNGWITIDEAMTIIDGLAKAVLDYTWWKEKKTKKRFY